MVRSSVNQGLTLVFPLMLSSICVFAGGCNQLLDVTSITAVDGSVLANSSVMNDGGVVKDGFIANDGGVDQVDDGQATSGNNFCDRAFWTATASVHGGGTGPPAGIDGDLATRWSTERNQDGTDW